MFFYLKYVFIYKKIKNLLTYLLHHLILKNLFLKKINKKRGKYLLYIFFIMFFYLNYCLNFYKKLNIQLFMFYHNI